MKFLLFLSFYLLLLLSSCQKPQLDPIEQLDNQAWGRIPETIVADNSTVAGQLDSLFIVKNTPMFPFNFYTYRPRTVIPYPVFGTGNAVVFGVGDAKLSLMVLPNEFSSQLQAKNYAKDILDVAFQDIKKTKTGYEASNLDKKQSIDIGHINSRYYLWLEDVPFDSPKESEQLFQQIRSHFRLVELTD